MKNEHELIMGRCYYCDILDGYPHVVKSSLATRYKHPLGRDLKLRAELNSVSGNRNRLFVKQSASDTMRLVQRGALLCQVT